MATPATGAAVRSLTTARVFARVLSFVTAGVIQRASETAALAAVAGFALGIVVGCFGQTAKHAKSACRAREATEEGSPHTKEEFFVEVLNACIELVGATEFVAEALPPGVGGRTTLRLAALAHCCAAG